MPDVTGEFTVTAMVGEDQLADTGAVRLTHAAGDQRFDGAIEGDGHVDWLMCYRTDKTADLVGLQRVDGTLDGRSGSFVLTSTGSHDGRESSGTWSIVEGSGTAELEGIRGAGTWHAGPGPQATWRLSYELGGARP
jgi:Protein of unknown function (DUF3224)